MATGYSFSSLSPGGGGLIVRESDGAHIPCDLANRDYQEFLLWLDEGNPAPEGWTGPTNDPPATA